MEKASLEKFNQNGDLKNFLLETRNEYLQEGNMWGDTFWGVDLKTGKGENNLGKLLMQIREKYREENIMAF